MDESFSAFAHREYPRVVGALTYLVGDVGVAEELAQDALVRAHDRWDRVGGLDRPGAWLHHVAVNLANSHFRRRRAERRALRRVAADPPSTVHDTAETLAVRAAVAALPRRQREVVAYRFFLGHDVATTAAALGIAEGTVTSTTADAVANLRRALGDSSLVPTSARSAP